MQPLDQFAGAASGGRIQGRQPVVSNAVQIGTAFEKILSRGLLPAMARRPERVRNLVWGRRRFTCERHLDTNHQSQSSGLLQQRPRAALD